MALQLEEIDRLKRKLRKKLRQIENLEIIDRELNNEELDKVSKKSEIRAELASLINQCDVNNTEEEMKRKSGDDGSFKVGDDLDDSEQSSKRICTSESVGVPEPSNPLNDEDTNSIASYEEDHNKACNEDTNPIASYEEDHNKACNEDINDFVVVPPLTDLPSTSQEISESNSESARPVETSVVNTDHVTTPLCDATNQAKSQPRSQETTSKQSVSKDPKIKNAKAAPKKQQSKLKQPEPGAHWKKTEWEVEELEGHDDLILSSDIDLAAGIVATASRDTTVKVWSIETGSLMHSLRGHTGPVTGVKILSKCDGLGDSLDWPDLKRCGVSAGVDCTIRVWDLDRGEMVKSYYTYNGITCLAFVPNSLVSLTGTDGGKVELYNLATGHNIHSNRWHEEAVTSLSSRLTPEASLVASAGKDGLVKLYSAQEDRLNCIFVSENLTAVGPESSIHLRPIYSVQILENGWIYYGDDGANIKAIDWRHGKLSKVANHTENVGFTDCLTSAGDLLISSNFDIDTGLGGVNLFLSGMEGVVKYLATLSDLDTGRISHVSVGRSDQGGIALVTAGQELKLWTLKTTAAKRDCSTAIRSCVLTLSENRIQDSGSDEEDDDEGSDNADVRAAFNASGLPLRNKPGTGYCNCAVM